MTVRVYFYDEAPRIGCGWRTVEIICKGHKWVRIRYQDQQCVKLKRAVWNDIERSAQHNP